jgi:chromosome segregation ATPase
MKGTPKLAQSDARLPSFNKSALDNVKKSTSAMKEGLEAEMRLSSLTNAQTGSKIAKLQEKGTFYAKQIEVEAKKLHDLERQIEMVQESINEKRAKLRKVEGNTSDSLGKDIKKLERNLDKTLQKHNEILADNRQLKEEIDHLRRERVTFDKIYKKLEVELQSKKKTLNEVFADSEKAKEKKKKIEEQIKNLKLRVQKEENNIEREFQDIFKDINEKNVADRIEEKFGALQERTGPGRKREMESPSKGGNVLENSYGEEGMSRSSVRKGVRSIEKKPRDVTGKTPQEEVEEYNSIFESLKKKTHKNDLKEILTLFEDYETKNYSLYQHLTHLSDEKESLDKQIQSIKEEIGSLTQAQNKDSGEHADNKVQKIQQLKDEIEESDKHFGFLEKKQGGLTETINALKISIPIIFERIGCNIEDYANELIDGTTVNEGNMLQYLAIIEKKTNEILQMYHFSQNKTDNTTKNAAQRGNEEVNVSITTFPNDLLNEMALTAAPEKADIQNFKEYEEFEEDAKKKVRAAIDKKATKPTKGA